MSAAIDALEHVRALRERAAADNLAGRPLDAAGALETALAELDRIQTRGRAGGSPPDPAELVRDRAKTMVTYGLTDFLLAGLPAALERLGVAERLAGELADAGLLARVRFQRASIHGRAGDLAAAWRDFDGVLEHLDAFTDREQCSVLLARGMLAVKQARPREAVDAFARAAALAERLGFLEQEVMARHNQGYAAHLLGDVPRALALMGAAAERGGSVAVATMRLDRAAALLEAGLAREAVEVLVAGRAELPDEGSDLARGEFHLDLAKADRILGRPARASANAQEAAAAYGRVGATAWAARARLVALQARLDELRTPSRPPGSPRRRSPTDESVARSVADACDRVAATAGHVGDAGLADTARVTAAEAELLAGDHEAADRRLGDRPRRAPGSLSEQLAAAAVTASVHAACGRPAAARRVLAAAARRLAAGQSGSASLDVRTARAVHGIRLADLDLDLALGHGSGAVLAALERWRAATDRLPRLGRPEDELLAALTDELRAVHAQLRAGGAEGRSPELQARARRLERAVRARDWTLATVHAGPARQAPRLHEARAALAAADRDLLWFFSARGRLCGVGVQAGRARVRDLLDLDRAAELARRVRADLRVAASRRLGPLGEAVWGSLHAAAAELDAALLRPWGERAPGLVVVACSELAALPWALLPSLRDRPVTVARSLSGFAAGAGGGSPVASVHVSVGPGVERAGAEGQAVAAAWSGPGGPAAGVELAAPSSRARLLAALGAADVVHVAAHGVHEPQSPLFSSVSLDDGPLFAHEVQPHGVAASHIVLSACDVGTPAVRPGEEALGLAASLLALGAASAVAAVAPVPDDVAAEAMVRHHLALVAGLPSDEALVTALGGCDPVARAFVNLGTTWRPPAP